MFQLALRRGGETGVPKTFLTKLSLFKTKPELVGTGRYAIQSDVDPDVFAMFMTRLYGGETEKVTPANADQLRALCDELGFSGFDEELRAVQAAAGDWRVRKDLVCVRGRVERHDVLLEQLQLRVLELERRLGAVEEVPARIESVERRLEATARGLDELRRKDVSGDVARLRKEVSERAMAADLAALSEEVSRLKVAEATVQVTKPAPAANTRPQQQKVPEHVQAPTRITLVYDSLRPLEGVIAYLTGKYGGNVQEKGVVEVTASTFCFCKPKNAAELGTDSCFFSKDDPDSWLCYDFKEWRVTPTSYSIRTANWHFPKSWVLEVSNDGSDGSWDVVDRRDDNHDNNDKRVTHNFPLSAPRLAIRGFRFVRLRQTGANHDGHHNLALTSLEIFGILLSKLDTS